MNVRAVLFALLISQVASIANILDFGAIPSTNTNEAAETNAVALQKAFYAANSSPTSDRIVLIPESKEFYIFAAEVFNVHDITIQLDGRLVISNNITAFPQPSQFNHTFAALYIGDSSNIHLTGYGQFDGQGYDWWWSIILLEIHNRPHMVAMERVEGIVIDNLYFTNSPNFHLRLHDIKDLHVKNITIYVDTESQHAMLQKSGNWHEERGVPTFPLNTDGIDPSGINILIEDVNIENYDDAVAVKPCSGECTFSTCTENVLVRNSQVTLGVGMTIGSVPPKSTVNCVRNVTFDNIVFTKPIKALYVKTNPGTEGTGIIDNITYKNIVGDGALWYPIWIGPQQQQQPGSKGTGCSFFYPIDDECPTQPRVPVTNIHLSNITFTNGLELPGVLLCDPERPCTGFTFDHVSNEGEFGVQKEYVCKNVKGTSTSSFPTPSCF